jgi:hypothetical protein
MDAKTQPLIPHFCNPCSFLNVGGALSAWTTNRNYQLQTKVVIAMTYPTWWTGMDHTYNFIVIFYDFVMKTVHDWFSLD